MRAFSRIAIVHVQNNYECQTGDKDPQKECSQHEHLPATVAKLRRRILFRPSCQNTEIEDRAAYELERTYEPQESLWLVTELVTHTLPLILKDKTLPVPESGDPSKTDNRAKLNSHTLLQLSCLLGNQYSRGPEMGLTKFYPSESTAARLGISGVAVSLFSLQSRDSVSSISRKTLQQVLQKCCKRQ